jgi:photosystem II stability/assembly factor-like uncharacterized protein
MQAGFAPTKIIPTSSTITLAPTKTAMPTSTATPIPLAWKRIYIGQEFPRDSINVIVFDPKDPDVIYVGTQNAGVYKSIDGGLSWQPAHEGLGGAWVSSLVIDHQDPQTLYAGIALAGIYKTTDRGDNWFPINNGIDTNGWDWVAMLAISRTDSQQLYFSQGRSLYSSSNGGDTWVELLSAGDLSSTCPRQIVNIAIDPIDPAHVLAFNIENPVEEMVCQEGVYESPDGGRSWSLALQVEPVYGLHPAGINYDWNWEHIYASSKAGVFRSDDRAKTWQPAESLCDSVAADPQDGMTAYCFNSGENVRVTRNGGDDWEEILKGLSSLPAIAVSPHSSQTMYVGGNGLQMSTDGGETWMASNNGMAAFHRDLSFDPMEPSAMLLEDETCTVYRSSDGGSQWTLAPDRTCQSRTALSASGERLYWIDEEDGSLRVSTDLGISSDKLNWPIEASTERTIASLPVNEDRLIAVYSFESPYFFVSDDHGESWRGANLIDWDPCCSNPGPGPRLAFDQSSAQTVYLISLEKVFRSDDAGETWRECVNRGNTGSWLGTSTRKGGMIVQPGNADSILLATRGNGILSSRNGCQSWQPSNKGLSNLFVNSLAYEPNNPNIVYAGTDGGAYISYDAGATWGQVNDGLLGATVVYSIAIDPESNVYAATPYGIFKLESK